MIGFKSLSYLKQKSYYLLYYQIYFFANDDLVLIILKMERNFDSSNVNLLLTG